MSAVIPEIEPPKPRKFIKQPDVAAKNKQIATLNEQITKLETQINSLSAQLDATVSPKADNEKRQALTSELRKTIQSQDEIKKKRQHINEQVRLIDQTIKKKVAEITSKTSKYNFKTVEEIDRKIQKLESEVESGSLMLVQEKKAMKEISSLNKLKKDFAGIEVIQKSIDAEKAKIAELKETLSTVSNKEAQATFEVVTKELNELTNKNKGVQSKRDELFTKRRALQNEKYELLKQIRKIRDDFDAKFKKFKADMDNERKKREEDEKAYTLYLERNDLLEEIEELEDANKVGETNEQVETLKRIIKTLDPSYKFADETETLKQLNSFSLDNRPTKTVEIKLPENAELIQKTEETFFAGSGIKGKKGKKKNNSSNKKSLVDVHTATQLTILAVEIPTSEEQFPETVKALVAKLEEEQKAEKAAAEEFVKKNSSRIATLKEKVAELEKQILEELAKEKERAAARKAAAEATAAEEVADENAEASEEA